MGGHTTPTILTNTKLNMKLSDDEVIYTGRLRGGYGDNGWISSSPLLITKAGKWKLRYWSVDAGACGRPDRLG